MILSDAIYLWMNTYKRNSVKPTTFDRLETSYALLRRDKISSIELTELSTDDIQSYINRLVAEQYSLSTIKKQYHLISSYINYAILDGCISKPFHKGVALPSQSSVLKKRRDVEIYSQSEQEALKRVLLTNARVGYGAAVLMLEVGLRVGEALALTWDDILWERRAIKVCKTAIRITNHRIMAIQDGAKSFTSNRTVPLSSTALAFLKRLYSNRRSEYLFPDSCGDPITYEALRFQIQRACLEAKVPYKGQHVFRHTFATNCYNRGCDVKILSKLLGHADVTITYNVYIHLFGDALEEMRSVVG